MVGMVLAPTAAEVAMVTNAQRVVRLPVETVALFGKDGKGDRISALNPNEKIITVTVLASNQTSS